MEIQLSQNQFLMFFVLLMNSAPLSIIHRPYICEFLLDYHFYSNGLSILIPVPYCFVYKWLLITKENSHKIVSLKKTSNHLRLKDPFTWKHHWFGGLLCILGVLLLFQCGQHSPQIQLYWSLALLSTFKIILKSSKIISLFIIIHFTSCAFHLMTKRNRFRL